MSVTQYKCEDCEATFRDPVFFLSDDLGNCPECDSEYIEPYEVQTIAERHAKADEIHEASLAWRAMSEAERDALRTKADAHLAAIKQTLDELNEQSLRASRLSAERFVTMNAALDAIVELARGNFEVPTYSESFLRKRQAS